MRTTFNVLDSYCNYLYSAKGRSALTIKNYRVSVVRFFRFVKKYRGLSEPGVIFEDIPLNDIDVKFIESITTDDIMAFLTWLGNDMSLTNSSRARYMASLRSFFMFCVKQKKILKENPASDVDTPKTGIRMPCYLNLDDSEKLLDVALWGGEKANNRLVKRNYCIIVFFLNCGLRLAELRGIDIDRIEGNVLKVIGKGNKERTVYLNDACMEALGDWLSDREKIAKSVSLSKSAEKALFISIRGNRISDDAVQYAVKRLFVLAGLDAKKLSVHKLRHTAATLMYQYGHVDIRSLQTILGHQSVSTTQIYTHVSDEQIREAVSSNPLANYNTD